MLSGRLNMLATDDSVQIECLIPVWQFVFNQNKEVEASR